MKLGIKDGLKHIFYIELEISGDGINTFFNMCRKKEISRVKMKNKERE